MHQPESQHLYKHPAMPRLGQRLDERYELLEVLGEGGASVVYRARDGLAGGEVAVKVLSPRKSRDPEFSLRFQREARLLRELEHPNIVSVANVGSTDKGCLFIVQELLVGADIAQTLAHDGPLPVERVIRISSQVLRALLEAHQHGVVHRDLKPQNIMICDFPGEIDFIKVLDFGMAKSTVSDGVETAPGQVLVTPAYAAPELLSGGPATPAADIYALGLLCLEMLTGEQTVKAPTVWGIIAWQSGDDPVVIPPQVSALPISRVIAKAVQKDRHNRFQNAHEMLDALADPESVTKDDPVVLESLPAPQPEGRRFVTVGAVVLVVAALAVGLWLAFGRATSTEVTSSDVEPVDTETDTADRRIERCRQGDLDLCLEIGFGEASESGPTGPAEHVSEALDRACTDGRLPRACGELASRYRAGVAVDIDLERASQYSIMTCDLGDIEMCLRAGFDHLNGTDLALDRRKARQLLEPACEADRFSACAGLAAIYANGWDVEQDLSQAAQYYERACRGDVVEACTRLGTLHQRGRGVAEDLEQARSLYELACDRDDLAACANLGTLFHRALGVEADSERARELYERACEGGFAQACAGLGTIYETAFGVDADAARAGELFERACDGGEPIGCISVARLIRAGSLEGGEERERTYLQRACEAGYQPACDTDSPP